MGFFSEMHAALPGIDAIRENIEAAITWGPWEVNRAYVVPVIMDGSARDAGNTPTTLLRPGLMLGQVRSTAGTDPLKWKEWSPAGTDGTQDFAGILLWDASMQMFSTDKDRWFGYALVGGQVKAASVLYPGQSSAGLSGIAMEHYARGVMAARYLFDDSYHQWVGSALLGGWKNFLAKTSAYTVVNQDNGTLFTTLGAVGAVTFTLPAITASKGQRYGFYSAADQTMTVASAAAADLITFNNIAASSVAFSTGTEKIGGYVEVLGLDNNKWAVVAHGSNTLTVA